MSRKRLSIYLIRVVVVVAILAATGLLGVPSVYGGGGDDNDETYPEVGVVGMGDYNDDGDYKDSNDLQYAVQSAKGFYYELRYVAGWSREFYEMDSDVYERYFKREICGGEDSEYADACDICWFQGHSNDWAEPQLTLSFVETGEDDKYLEYWEARWGDWDAEWMLIHTCKLFHSDWRSYWSLARHCHLICSAKTDMWDSNDGESVGERLIDSGANDVAYTVKYSWFYGLNWRQHFVTLYVMGENQECGNDYIWGQGQVCDDPPRDSTYYYWTYFCW
jgi:hypothetical protein